MLYEQSDIKAAAISHFRQLLEPISMCATLIDQGTRRFRADTAAARGAGLDRWKELSKCTLTQRISAILTRVSGDRRNIDRQ